jgi:hypothetical protein
VKNTNYEAPHNVVFSNVLLLHLSSFQNNIFLSLLFSNTLSVCSSLKTRDPVSHPYKIYRLKYISVYFNPHKTMTEEVDVPLTFRLVFGRFYTGISAGT